GDAYGSRRGPPDPALPGPDRRRVALGKVLRVVEDRRHAGPAGRGGPLHGRQRVRLFLYVEQVRPQPAHEPGGRGGVGVELYGPRTEHRQGEDLASEADAPLRGQWAPGVLVEPAPGHDQVDVAQLSLQLAVDALVGV